VNRTRANQILSILMYKSNTTPNHSVTLCRRDEKGRGWRQSVVLQFNTFTGVFRSLTESMFATTKGISTCTSLTILSCEHEWRKTSDAPLTLHKGAPRRTTYENGETNTLQLMGKHSCLKSVNVSPHDSGTLVTEKTRDVRSL
jgi:hypothetical protein